MGKTKQHSANARQRVYDSQPSRTLTRADWSQIRFTQRMIHPTFSNRKELTVFDMYFAVRYQLMDVSDIPPIRVFEDATGKLWSVDNRRLWVMKTARRGFHCENLYTREQDPKRFEELQCKIRSLHGATGEYVWFRSRELADSIHQCCITAYKRRQLDDHIATIHLNIDLRKMTLLTQCPVHYKDRVSCTCLTKENSGTLKNMIRYRCYTVQRIMTNAQLTPSNEYTKLFEKLGTITTNLPSEYGELFNSRALYDF